jgi:hypothetical protein
MIAYGDHTILPDLVDGRMVSALGSVAVKNAILKRVIDVIATRDQGQEVRLDYLVFGVTQCNVQYSIGTWSSLFYSLSLQESRTSHYFKDC